MATRRLHDTLLLLTVARASCSVNAAAVAGPARLPASSGIAKAARSRLPPSQLVHRGERIAPPSGSSRYDDISMVSQTSCGPLQCRCPAKAEHAIWHACCGPCYSIRSATLCLVLHRAADNVITESSMPRILLKIGTSFEIELLGIGSLYIRIGSFERFYKRGLPGRSRKWYSARRN